MHQNKNQNKQIKHEPVLLNAVLANLAPKTGESYLDLTAGYGGHAAAVLEYTHQPKGMILVDRDQYAVDTLRQQFRKDVEIRHQDFYQASLELLEAGHRFDLILADLGVSSPHLNEGERGFAFRESGPLDMRMDQRQALTAQTILNTYSEAQLTDILTRFGEEPKARHIARLIIANRPLDTTTELARLVSQAWPGYSRVHPATRTFQAIRIAVNDELGLLERSLPLWLKLVAPGGRIAIISFHSLEDRTVKRALAEVSGAGYDAEFKLLTKRPITADPHELVLNPRARSAKLRAAAKIKIKEGNAHAHSGKKQLPVV